MLSLGTVLEIYREIYSNPYDLGLVISASKKGNDKYAVSICRRKLGCTYEVLIMSLSVIKSREDAIKVIQTILEMSENISSFGAQGTDVLTQSMINEIIGLLKINNSVYTSKDGLLSLA